MALPAAGLTAEDWDKFRNHAIVLVMKQPLTLFFYFLIICKSYCTINFRPFPRLSVLFLNATYSLGERVVIIYHCSKMSLGLAVSSQFLRLNIICKHFSIEPPELQIQSE